MVDGINLIVTTLSRVFPSFLANGIQTILSFWLLHWLKLPLTPLNSIRSMRYIYIIHHSSYFHILSFDVCVVSLVIMITTFFSIHVTFISIL